MNGAAEEKSPGTSTGSSAIRSARSTLTELGRMRHARAGGAQHQLGVVARRCRLDHGRAARSRRGRRAARPTSPARSRPAARSRSRAAARPVTVSGRWPSVVSICAPIRRSGAAIRSIGRAESDSSPVSVNVPVLEREQPDDQPRERARVAAVDLGGLQAAQADAVHDELVAVLVDLHAERRARRRASTRCRPSGRSRGRRSSPSETAPSSSARCEIDLSPGTAKWPSSATAGSTLIDHRARRRRCSPGPRAAPPRAAPRLRR